MKRKLILFLMCFAAALVSLALQRDEQDASLDKLATYLTGHFHSGAQAASDSSYFEIHMQAERIWETRTDGYWLYVEQAAEGSLDQPYEQHVYHLMRDSSGRLVSLVYDIPGQDKYIGAWEDPALFAGLQPDGLQLRKGCEVWIEPENAGFLGTTRAGDCNSIMRGAHYATSMIEIDGKGIRSWDKGYNSAHQLLLNGETGAYVLVRQ